MSEQEHEHECVFVEEQEPSGRLILPPCIVCGLTAMDAIKRTANEREDAYVTIRTLVGGDTDGE